MEIDPADLGVLLEGLELSANRRRTTRVAPAVALR